jgi:hypothetical protein
MPKFGPYFDIGHSTFYILQFLRPQCTDGLREAPLLPGEVPEEA